MVTGKTGCAPRSARTQELARNPEETQGNIVRMGRRSGLDSLWLMPPTGKNCGCGWAEKSWSLSQQPLWIQESQVFHRRISPTKHPWKVLEHSMCRWWMWGGVKVWGGDARGIEGVETPPSSIWWHGTEDLKENTHIYGSCKCNNPLSLTGNSSCVILDTNMNSAVYNNTHYFLISSSWWSVFFSMNSKQTKKTKAI